MRSKSPRPSRIREERRDDDYRAWLRRQPCAIADEIGHARDCRTYGADGCDAAHLGDRGTGIKAPDRTCVPLCRGHHEDQHNVRGSWPRDRGERTTMYKRLIALWNRRYVDDGGRFADRGRAS